MLRIRTFAAFAVVGATFLPAAAGAQQGTLLHRQAWHDCLRYVQQVTSPSPEADQERIAQFMACMTERHVTP
jgi:hypothetical protein